MDIHFDLFLAPPAGPVRNELRAVISHYGSSDSGHYKAFLSPSDKWVECDDSDVRIVDFDESRTTGITFETGASHCC